MTSDADGVRNLRITQDSFYGSVSSDNEDDLSRFNRVGLLKADVQCRGIHFCDSLLKRPELISSAFLCREVRCSLFCQSLEIICAGRTPGSNQHKTCTDMSY